MNEYRKIDGEILVVDVFLAVASKVGAELIPAEAAGVCCRIVWAQAL